MLQPSTADSDLNSLREFLELSGHRAWLELLILSEGELAGCLASHTAKDHAVQQRVATQAVVAVNAASSLTCHVETRDDLSRLVDAFGIYGAFQTAHAVVNHGGDDGNL